MNKCSFEGQTEFNCSGSDNIQEYSIFHNLIDVFLCDKHYANHYNIMILHKYGRNVEDIVNLSFEEVQQEVNKLKNEGKDIILKDGEI